MKNQDSKLERKIGGMMIWGYVLLLMNLLV